MPAPPSYLTYSNKVEYKIAYPSDWNPSDYSEYPDVIGEFSSPTADSFVLVLKVNGDIRQSDPDLAAAVVVSSQALTVGGIPATEEIFDANINNGDGTFEQASLMLTSFSLNGFTYGVVYLSSPENFNTNIDIARYMTQSLNVAQVIFSNLSVGSYRPAVATDGVNFLVATCDHPNGSSSAGTSSLIAKMVYRDRSTSEQIDIANEYVTPGWMVPACSFDPSIAYDGSNFLVVYASAGEIYAKRVASDGSITDSSPILVSISEEPYLAEQPKVAFDGSNFLVIWYSGRDSHQLLVSKISTQGSVSAPIVLQDVVPDYICDIEPHIAVSERNIMVMWSESLCGGYLYYSSHNLYAGLYDFDGNSLLDAPLEIHAAGSDLVLDPQIASGDDSYLVSWIGGEIQSDSPTAQIQNPAIYVARISQEGLPFDSVNGSLAITSRTGWSASKADLSLNFHDGQYFFAWDCGYFIGISDGVHGLSLGQEFIGDHSFNPSDLGAITAESSYPYSKSVTSFSRDQSIFISQNDDTLYGWYFNPDDF